MALNQVSVVGPRTSSSDQKAPKKSTLDMILEGVQLANGVLGIGDHVESIRNNQANIEAKDAEKRGVFTPEKMTELQKTHDLSDSPMANSIRGLKLNEDGSESPIFASLKAKEAKPPEIERLTTPGPDGNPVYQFVEKKPGISLPAYQKPEKQDLTSVVTVDENGNEVTQIVPKVAGSSFLKPHNTENQDKVYTELVGKVTTPRGNQAVQRAQTSLISIKNAQELIDQYPDSNQMPQQQVNLLNQELAKVASGGVGSEHGQKSLEANTYREKWQEFMSKVDNKPTGADLGAFIEQNKAYLGNLEKVNNNVVYDYQKKIYNSYKPRLSPDQQKQFETEYPDVFGSGDLKQGSQAPKNSHPDDAKALDWAQKNRLSKDPETASKALQILKLNGG